MNVATSNLAVKRTRLRRAAYFVR
ncbi:DUF1010 domain-containing protein [Melaminivora suipulveris]